MIEHNHEQHSAEWFSSRVGIPTASSASKLITSTGAASKQISAYAEKLAADKFAGKNIDAWQGNQFTERGNEIEQEARQWYSFERDIDIREAGFCTDSLGRYGASPDGFIDGGGLLEIKCLPKNHMAAILRWHTKKTPPTDYLPQIHMQMLVCEEPWADLLYYHPDLPKAIIRIERDPAIDKALNLQINNCIAQRDAVHKQLQEMAA